MACLFEIPLAASARSNRKGPSAEELAAHLAFQLERLQAMREAAAKILARDQKGRDFFVRGIPEDVTRIRKVTYTATLLDLMQGYARIRTRDEFRPYAMDRTEVMTLEQALDRMRGLIGYSGEWTDLMSFLPEDWNMDPGRRRSATAANFAAILELAKAGSLEVRQSETFSKIEIRKKDRQDLSAETEDSLFEAPPLAEQVRIFGQE